MISPLLDNAISHMGNSLFEFSDSVRSSGMLMSDEAHRRYERVVSAWSDLTDELAAFELAAHRKMASIEDTLAQILSASAIEAQSDATGTGAAEGESAAPNGGDAQ